MWISRQMVSNKQNKSDIQTGTSRLNKNGVGVVSTGGERNIKVYSPYGYTFSLPSGVDMILANCAGQQSAIGTLSDNSGINEGEIKISSKSGAYIYLRSDGCIEINGLVINSKGVIDDEE